MPSFSKNRIEIFSDAVIAIAMTLLVLELHPPEVPESASLAQYAAAMAPIWPKVGSFVLAFVTISIHWVGHHYLYRHLDKATLGLVWLNNLFLLGICFLPFPTAMLGDYPTGQFPVLIFTINSLLISLTFMAIRTYAVRAQLFKKPEYNVSMGPRHSLPAVGLYALAALLALVNTYLSLICLFVVVLLYFAPTVLLGIRRKAADIVPTP